MRTRLGLSLLLATAAASAAAQAAETAQKKTGGDAQAIAPAADAKSGVAPAKKPAQADAQATASTDAKRPTAPAGDMVLSGLSILGNDETPKELVIVPWKSSQLADAPGISRLLDDSTQPVDKDVFQREFEYFKFKSDDSGSD